MAPAVMRVEPDKEIPGKVDVAIIGGGIVGVSAALFLAQKGVSVVLCEKGEIGAEQSSRNWGWCRTQSRDPRELPLSIESLRLWRGMNELTGEETGFRECGILSLCKSDAELATARGWEEEARRYQLQARVLTPEELPSVAPGLAGDWKGGLYSPTDGRAEPSMAAPAIARGARRHGATILTNCAVRGIETSAGAVSGIVTEKGRIAASSVVLAGGVWSSLMCDQIGVRLPQLKVLGNLMRTAPLEGGPEVSAKGPGFGMRKRLDGGYNIAFGQSNEAQIVPDSFRYFFDFLPRAIAERKSLRLRLGARFMQEWRWARRWKMDEVSPFEHVRTLDPKPLAYDLDQAKRNIQAAYPIFRKMQVVESWAGLIDATPDAVPVISAVDDLTGLFLSTGYSGHGFGLGPGGGKLTAQLVMGETPLVDPAPFRFARLAKGKRAVLNPGVFR
ncbi:MAG: FAD-binding oxidoreductase [Rhizobiaceae bacterium]